MLKKEKYVENCLCGKISIDNFREGFYNQLCNGCEEKRMTIIRPKEKGSLAENPPAAGHQDTSEPFRESETCPHVTGEAETPHDFGVKLGGTASSIRPMRLIAWGFFYTAMQTKGGNSMLTQAPRGTKDVLPQDSYRWQAVEAKMREAAALAGYREVRTPVFEHTELFARGVGDTTDIVQKEMYTFKDKGDRSITLKPEGTAGVARAFLESNLYAEALPCKMYYLDAPIFRYEAPQNGRLREHHQFGLECFGAPEATTDAELILLAYRLVSSLGVKNLSVRINSIGCPNCRPAYHQELKSFLSGKVDELCSTCKTRYERNPLRVLDCKEKHCQELVADAPSMLDLLCPDCKKHFEELQACLTAAGIPYVVDSRIVRGLDYYTKTVFELVTTTPDGNLTVCGGGRYDNLVEQLGGPSIPAVGFGMGIERLLMLLDSEGIELPRPNTLDVFVTYMGDAKLPAFQLVERLREAGVKADMDHCGRSLKAQFKFANKTGAPITATLGEEEIQQGVVKLRDMNTREEKVVPIADAAAAVREMLNK